MEFKADSVLGKKEDLLSTFYLDDIEDTAMTYYLVDVENTANHWMESMRPEENKKVFLFYTEPNRHISYADLDKILKGNINLSMLLCKKGANALDFQLATYLGMLIATAKEKDRFVILSNDRGYDVICHFWSEKGFHVERRSFICEKTNSTASSNELKPKSISDQCIELIQNHLPKDEKEYAKCIFSILDKQKRSNLQIIYQSIIKKFGQKQGLSIYKHVKPLIKKIQDMLTET